MKTQPNLLVIDDQAQYLHSLERAFRGDFHVVSATSVDEAMGLVSEEFALIVVDIRLDERNDNDRSGLDIVRDVRARFPKLPIMAMSALDASNIDHAAISAGASRFLKKPIVLSELRKVIADLIGKRD